MLTALAHLILACSRSRSLIADSIRDEPEKWTFDTYYASHKSQKVRVWIANDCYGLHLETSSKPQNRNTSQADWNRTTLCWAERRLIWREARQLLRAKKRSDQRAADKTLKAVLEETL